MRYPQFTYEESEAQRGQVICLRFYILSSGSLDVWVCTHATLTGSACAYPRPAGGGNDVQGCTRATLSSGSLVPESILIIIVLVF